MNFTEEKQEINIQFEGQDLLSNKLFAGKTTLDVYEVLILEVEK